MQDTNMFKNYNAIPPNYVPNNVCPPIRTSTIEPITPLEMYNAKGELIGYSWYYGNAVILNFLITGEVIYDKGEGDSPTGYAEDASSYLNEKRILQLDIFNFRYESVYSKQILASSNVEFYIEKCLATKLVKGIYYGRLTLIDETGEKYTLWPNNDEDFIFMVK